MKSGTGTKIRGTVPSRPLPIPAQMWLIFSGAQSNDLEQPTKLWATLVFDPRSEGINWLILMNSIFVKNQLKIRNRISPRTNFGRSQENSIQNKSNSSMRCLILILCLNLYENFKPAALAVWKVLARNCNWSYTQVVVARLFFYLVDPMDQFNRDNPAITCIYQIYKKVL